VAKLIPSQQYRRLRQQASKMVVAELIPSEKRSTTKDELGVGSFIWSGFSITLGDSIL